MLLNFIVYTQLNCTAQTSNYGIFNQTCLHVLQFHVRHFSAPYWRYFMLICRLAAWMCVAVVAINAALRWGSLHNSRRRKCQPPSRHVVSTTSSSRASQRKATSDTGTHARCTPVIWTRKSVSSSACAVHQSSVTPIPSCDLISASAANLDRGYL